MSKSIVVIGLVFSIALHVVFSAGCGAASQSKGTRYANVDGQSLPAHLLGDAHRRYFGLQLDDKERSELQVSLLATFAEAAEVAISASDYEGVLVEFGNMTELLHPGELREDRVPDALHNVAEYIVGEAALRGEEANSLSALLVLATITERKEHQERYQEIAHWGRSAREHNPDVFKRYGELIDVWDGHAQLTPHQTVLKTLAGLHIERRNAAANAFTRKDGPIGSSHPMARRVSRLAPLDVATVFLRQADLASAITYVQATGADVETELQLLALLRRAEKDGEQGADATIKLVDNFRLARPKVALGLCRDGLRRFPQDFRFPTCLARVSAERGEYSDAAAWYVWAIEKSPDRRDLYDEALARINRFIEQRLIETDPQQSREISERANQILRSRQERWPNSEPPLPPERLEFLVGMLEMNAGNAVAARRHLEASLDEHETDTAAYQLGLLMLRVGEPRAAESSLRRALKLTPGQRREDRLQRAEILERIGQASSAQFANKRAAVSYRRALEYWSNASDGVEGAPLARLEIHRGVLLDKLGDHGKAVAAFKAAMAAAPQWRETYASILSYLVISSPDVELARYVWRRAQLQLTLPPEWKVYFSLWVRAISARAGVAAPDENTALLRRLSKSTSWWGRLARFGSGELDYPGLLEFASGLGEEAEAHFYEGTRLLEARQSSTANSLFQKVLDTRMVNFYEYEMARSLIRRTKKAGAR